MVQKLWLNNNEKILPSYFCQQQKILASMNAFYTLRIKTAYYGVPFDEIFDRRDQNLLLTTH